ncbi:SLAP domain-containing protein [Lactobacillus sp. ESL0684]|uniref:SLAP domain-containing protein n=1 Tax=Lactobacillus sp. ESL0684 TaxID=2983213 RepID=UPI0023F9BB08|nr:SLAP domain-containing protein [Lactobacillus sp. ESL0684]WEV43476.1 SLAP domain-containing protein [Lactobacillus sp. ESL0684]
MTSNKYYLGTSIAAAVLLTLGLTSMSNDVQASDIPSVLLQDNQPGKSDPLLDGKYVSNGYSDDGFTFLKPTATSPEREDSYHLNVDRDWSNDLQTIIYDEENQEYVIYYLHTANVTNSDTGKQQNWDRVTTKDFIHFSKPTTALRDLSGDIGDAWSSAWTGSIITNQGQIIGVPKGAKVAYFSGLSNKDNQQNVWAAWSDDNGKTFSHPLNDKKIILDHYWDWTSINRSDERDPAVFYWQGKLMMYLAEGDNIGVYQSEDGINWANAKGSQKDSKIPSKDFLKGLPFEAPVECPVIRSMKTTDGKVKQVLFVGSKAPGANQTTGTYYTVGHVDDDGMFVPETDAKRLDQGTDYYGANFSGSEYLAHADSDLITMGWVGNWNYINSGIKANQNGYAPNSKRLGAYTLARKITLNNDLTLKSVPITTGLEAGKAESKDGKVSEQVKGENDYYELLNLTRQPANSKYTLHFATKDDQDYQGAVRIEFTQGKDHNVIIFDPTTGKYRIDGKSSELSGDAANYYQNGLESGLGYINDSGLKNTKDFGLTVYTDKTSIELFFSNGQAATMSRFCVNNIQDVKISAQDEQKNNQFEISYQEVGPKLVGYEAKVEPNIESSSTTNVPKQPAKENAVSEPESPTTIAQQETEKTVMHNAYVYNQAGKKTAQKIPAGKTVKTYGTKSINGKKYYVLADDQFLAAGNIDGTKRKLKHNAYVYNQHGKRIKGKHLKRNKQVRTYGSSVKLHGKRYYIVGKEQYVKQANF